MLKPRRRAAQQLHQVLWGPGLGPACDLGTGAQARSCGDVQLPARDPSLLLLKKGPERDALTALSMSS